MSDDDVLLETFLSVTDDLVTGLDVNAYLRRLTVRAAELLDVRAVAVLYAREDVLAVAASSCRLGHLLARYEVALREGPGVDAFRAGAPVECLELSAEKPRWPRLAPAAVHVGLAAAHAVPCRRRGDVLGVLTMYATRTGPLTTAVAELSRALANAVSIGMTACREQELAVRTDQLQHALHSRVVIEQAKGVLSERTHTSMSEALELLRGHARSHNAKLHDVARQVLSGTLVLPPRR
jgi:hypothetical protein